MTLDVEQIKQDMEAGTRGCWSIYEGPHEFRVIAAWSQEIRPESEPTFGDYRGAHICIVKFVDDASVPTRRRALNHARRIARVPDLEAAFVAQAAEIAALKDEAAKLDVQVLHLGDALRDCLSILDALIKESGREIEWGEEDPFRMGEWFEADDLARIKAARAALSAEGEE